MNHQNLTGRVLFPTCNVVTVKAGCESKKLAARISLRKPIKAYSRQLLIKKVPRFNLYEALRNHTKIFRRINQPPRQIILMEYFHFLSPILNRLAP